MIGDGGPMEVLMNGLSQGLGASLLLPGIATDGTWSLSESAMISIWNRQFFETCQKSDLRLA